MVVIALLYVPSVQRFAIDKALQIVNSDPQKMAVNVGYLRLRWPLNVELRDAMLSMDGDSMVSVKDAHVRARLLPLLMGDLDIRDAGVHGTVIRFGGPDSSIWLRGSIDSICLENVRMRLSDMNIRGSRLASGGINVDLIINEDTSVTPADSTPYSPLSVNLNEIDLDGVQYRMDMKPLITNLHVSVPSTRLRHASFDLPTQSIACREAIINGITAEYFYGATDSVAADTEAAEPLARPWDVRVDAVSITADSALYALEGASPLPGLDMNYLLARDIVIEADSVLSRGTELRLQLDKLSGRERCGIELLASGSLALDDSAMTLADWNISTLVSALSLSGRMPMNNASGALALEASGRIGLQDAAMAFPTASAMLAGLPRETFALVDARVSGTMDTVRVDQLSLRLQQIMSLDITGFAAMPLSTDCGTAHLTITGAITDARAATALLPATSRRSLRLAPLRLNGDVELDNGTGSARIKAVTGAGSVALDGKVALTPERYDLDLTATEFPISTFMPDAGIGHVTASVKAHGAGFDIRSRRTHSALDITLTKLEMGRSSLHDITATAALDTGMLRARLVSDNPALNATAILSARPTRDSITWNAHVDGRHIDLMTLGLADTINAGMLRLNTRGTIGRSIDDLRATLTVDTVAWNAAGMPVRAGGLTGSLDAADSLFHVSVLQGDMSAQLAGYVPLTAFISRLSETMTEVSQEVDSLRIDVRRLQEVLPPLALRIAAGSDNVVAGIASDAGVEFSSLKLGMRNDSTIVIGGSGLNLRMGSTALDTVRFSALQHGDFLLWRGTLGQRPGTMDGWAYVGLNGYVSANRLQAILRQRDINGQQGFFLGMMAETADTTVTLRFVPYEPTIGYKQWKFNEDNYITLNIPRRQIEANMTLSSGKSSLHIYNSPLVTERGDTLKGVSLDINDVQIADWLRLSPFAPAIDGTVSANAQVALLPRFATGHVNVNVGNLTYGRNRVGDIGLKASLAALKGRFLGALASLDINGARAMELHGMVEDTLQVDSSGVKPRPPFDLTLDIPGLPLNVANAFLPAGTASLSGKLLGRIEMRGRGGVPQIDGYLKFDSTDIYSRMAGTTLHVSDTPIKVDSGLVTFDRFAIKAVNDNPLYLDGTVNLRNAPMTIGVDLTARAQNMQLINSRRGNRAMVYGKLFVDLDATVSGTVTQMTATADLGILPQTNVTYVMTDAQSVISSHDTGDLVTFVNFADTTAVADEDTIVQTGSVLNIDATLTVDQGAVIGVDLSTDGKNRVQLQGQGTLEFSMSQTENERVTGRYTINSGFVRYTPPLLSEKLFDFVDGSYVSFTGNMMEPRLHVEAVDHLKANVTREGENSRLITFDVSVGITGTPSALDVKFNLSTEGDITVQNELSSMTAEQRATQAMNLLLYNVYTGPGTKASSNMAANPLFNFLEGQLNSWAAKNIKGVDLSFGIDQYERTYQGSTATATSYSYQVSKTLLNDRIKIVIGGSYSTDAAADENLEQNLINDISFEYMLNSSETMYLKVFRHTGYESILEGEITQTGVGFVIRRRLNSLRDLFKFPSAIRRKLTRGKHDNPVTTSETSGL